MFWEYFQQTSCLPVNCGCEFINLTEWIRQPANFWSSFVYLILGILLWRDAKTFYQRFWSVLCFILGLSSHLAHASFIQLAMSADFASIITLMIFPVVMHFSLRRGRAKNIAIITIFYLFIFGVMFYLDKFYKMGTCLVVFAWVLYYHFKNLKPELSSPLFIRSLSLLVLGFSFFILDEAKVLCDPHSLFQFHSVWHLLTAFSLYYYGKWIFYSGRW